MKHLIFAAGLIALTLAVPTSAEPPAEWETWLDEAAVALAEHRNEDFERLLRRAGETAGRLPAFSGLSRRLAAAGRLGDAVTLATSAAAGWIEEGLYVDAITILDQTAGLAPDSAKAHALLGEALALGQRHARAAEHLRRAKELGHGGAKLLFYLAAAEWENGRYDETERLYRQAIESTGESFLWLHQLGRLLAWQGRYAEGAAVLRRAAVLRPAAVDVQLDFARALEADAQLEDAAAVYRRLVELAPDLSYGHYGLARVLLRLGEKKAAQSELEIYRRLYEKESETLRREGVEQARLERGWELLAAGEAGAAIEHFRSLPASPATLEGRAAAHSTRGEHAAAVEALEKAVILAPERVDLQFLLTRERLAVRESP